MAAITFTNLTKHFRSRREVVRALDGFTLDVADGEFMVLLGPSGCGKTTALRILAGLETPTGGRVLIDGQDVTDLPPRQRDLAMVFQDAALYPHMSVRRNLAFGLARRGVPRDRREAAVAQAAGRLGLDDKLQRKPAGLSGGEKRRVALGRAIVRTPRAFLLDEPLSNLDAALRTSMRAELKRLHRELRTTTVLVTHDQQEAMTLADRVAVMQGGRIRQCGPPLELYRRPADRFVAGFVGWPRMNFLPGRLTIDGGSVRVAMGDASCRLESEGASSGEFRSGQSITVGVRPEHVMIEPADDAIALGSFTVELLEPLGHATYAYLKNDSTSLIARVPTDADLKPGGTITVYATPSNLHLFSDDDDGRRI